MQYFHSPQHHKWKLLLFSSFIDKRLCEHHILNIILPHHHMFNYLIILKICCLWIGLNKHPCNNASINDQKENVFLNFNTWQIVRLVIAISKYTLYCQCVVGPKTFSLFTSYTSNISITLQEDSIAHLPKYVHVFNYG